MKVALVIGSLAGGGSERQIIEFVRSAHPRHAECVVVCLGDEGPLAGEVRECGARVVSARLPRVARVTCRGAAVLGVARLVRILRRERPDVVYAFLFWGYTLALPAAAVAAPRALRVAGRRSHPDCDAPGRRGLRRARVLADRLCHGVIANSDAVAAVWTGVTPSLRSKMHVVPNGVRTINASGSPRVGARPVVICVANLIAYKGHATLLEAAARIAETDRRWSLLLVGDGPERAAIERGIAQRGIGDIVEVLGWRRDVDTLLARSDVVVLPSLSEGLPNAVMEGMAHGLPVAASDVGGVASLLGGGAGVVVPPGDAPALADALRGLLDDPAGRVEMGRRALALAHERYGIERMRDATLAVFEELARDRR